MANWIKLSRKVILLIQMKISDFFLEDRDRNTHYRNRKGELDLIMFLNLGHQECKCVFKRIGLLECKIEEEEVEEEEVEVEVNLKEEVEAILKVEEDICNHNIETNLILLEETW